MKTNSHNLWSDDEIEKLKTWYPIMSTTECADRLKRCYSSVRMKARRLGIRSKKFMGYDREAIYQKLTDLSRPESCYLLGLIWADGYICNSGFGISLVKYDMLELEWMIQNLGTLTRREYQPKKGNTKPQIAYSMGCKKLQAWLIERGYADKSQGTPSLLISEIPELNLRYFFRGWFDGDGCWQIHDQPHSLPACSWSVSGAYRQDWGEIEKLLNKLDLRYEVRRDIKALGRTSYPRIHKSSHVAILGDFVYEGREIDRIGLTRKYTKYLAIKENAAKIEKRQQDKLLKKKHELAFVRDHMHLSYREACEKLGVSENRLEYLRRIVVREGIGISSL